MDVMNNTMLFSVNEFTNVCKFVGCRGPEEFVKMYDSIGFIGRSYATEKYNLAIGNFSYWWCDLDSYTQEKIISYIKNFYSN